VELHFYKFTIYSQGPGRRPKGDVAPGPLKKKKKKKPVKQSC
jgi:hypothetical protein